MPALKTLTILGRQTIKRAISIQSDKSYYWNKHEVIEHRAGTTTCHKVFLEQLAGEKQHPEKQQIRVRVATEGRQLGVFQAERTGCTKS